MKNYIYKIIIATIALIIVFEFTIGRKFNQIDEISSKIIIPHIGFNQVIFPDTAIWSGIDKNSSFYFVHSYRVKKVKSNVKCGHTTYGEKFISFVEKKNVFGTQFHPEKSHTAGLKLLKNFVNL